MIFLEITEKQCVKERRPHSKALSLLIQHCAAILEIHVAELFSATTMWVNRPLLVRQLQANLAFHPSGVDKRVVGLFIDVCSGGAIWWMPTGL